MQLCDTMPHDGCADALIYQYQSFTACVRTTSDTDIIESFATLFAKLQVLRVWFASNSYSV